MNAVPEPDIEVSGIFGYSEELVTKLVNAAWPTTHVKFKRGDNVRKIRGSLWHGQVVGWYATKLTPEGYAVESSRELGAVQIYPAAALELVP